MGLLKFLESAGGLAVLYTMQSSLFALMLYILAAEFWRTREESLVYKLSAALAITVITAGTALIYMLESLYGIKTGQKFFPLVFNMLFSLNVLSLARAFTFDFVADKKRFVMFINGAMLVSVLIYAAAQIWWIAIFREGMVFWRSAAQGIFSLFFITMLGFSIYYLARFRKSYRGRLVTAFASIAIIQVIGLYGAVTGSVPAPLVIARGAIPIIVPVMFTSVVFKELIGRVVLMVEHLRNTFETQRDIVFELIQIGSELSVMSDSLVKSALDGWAKLSSVVESIREEIREGEVLREMAEKGSEAFNKAGAEGVLMEIEKLEEYKHEEITAEGKDFADCCSENIVKSAEHVAAALEFAERITSVLPDINSALDSIDDISDRTNILSLNASIEAARAGASGRGFAIVASEIGRLAESSLEGSGNIRRIFSAIEEMFVKFEGECRRGLLLLKGLQDEISSAHREEKPAGDEFMRDIPLDDLKSGFISYRDNIDSVFLGVERAVRIVSNGGKRASDMRDRISEHVRNIETMAGMGDVLNELINKLNSKINIIIKNSEELEKLM